MAPTTVKPFIMRAGPGIFCGFCSIFQRRDFKTWLAALRWGVKRAKEEAECPYSRHQPMEPSASGPMNPTRLPDRHHSSLAWRDYERDFFG